ncbi:hypothetical protein P280DRAFT_494613 [Massarina eburnea CBS 473.64]|uniref:Uncharacterized protein n=1 Tax=Massarina eburnea CBS 473.64 TaxID=1395130 RepID=A0A6A6SI80_9PLEO|nr:hypothetical protein P280DRAFT_494613 [Massarina eburnea CBS 473.64]
MPHKHKRKAGNDEANFNLPPTEHAAPLPVPKVRGTANSGPRNKKRKTNTVVEGYGADDTPKAFARLMAFSQGGKRRSGLDDGVKKTKKAKPTPQANKPAAAAATADVELETQTPVTSEAQQPQPRLKIMPGESLSDFRQRVNQALPLSSVARTGKKGAGKSDHRVTKHERHLKRLQAGWRAEEARIRDKEAEALELAEEENDERDMLWEDKTLDLPSLHPTSSKKKSGKKGKRKMVAGEVDDGGDEWEELRKKREQRKGLHDVVQAPPSLRVPREIFKVKNNAKVEVGNVPNKGGSLRKREELGVERQGIIETYRKLMASKREG